MNMLQQGLHAELCSMIAAKALARNITWLLLGSRARPARNTSMVPVPALIACTSTLCCHGNHFKSCAAAGMHLHRDGDSSRPSKASCSSRLAASGTSRARSPSTAGRLQGQEHPSDKNYQHLITRTHSSHYPPCSYTAFELCHHRPPTHAASNTAYSTVRQEALLRG